MQKCYFDLGLRIKLPSEVFDQDVVVDSFLALRVFGLVQFTSFDDSSVCPFKVMPLVVHSEVPC